MIEEYKSRHPIAWAVIAGVALFSAVAVGAIKGWIPIADNAIVQACNGCGVVESVRTVETPLMPVEPAAAGAEVSVDGSAAASPVAPDTQLAYSYESTVRFADGSTSVFSHAEPPSWQAGDKVRVVDGQILVSG